MTHGRDEVRSDFLLGLPRAWISIEVPGTALERMMATYVEYAGRVPPAPSSVADWQWLRSAPRHEQSDMAAGYDGAVRDLSVSALAELADASDRLPGDFVEFVSDTDLRRHTRSATGAYFDLGEEIVTVPGGRLLHVVSDSQWVMHWLLYLGDDGRSAVVATDYPAGFRLGADDLEQFRDVPWGCTRVADSFAEFMWRWWMDNEAFYVVVVDRSEPDGVLADYIAQYGAPRVLSEHGSKGE